MGETSRVRTHGRALQQYRCGETAITTSSNLVILGSNPSTGAKRRWESMWIHDTWIDGRVTEWEQRNVAVFTHVLNEMLDRFPRLVLYHWREGDTWFLVWKEILGVA